MAAQTSPKYTDMTSVPNAVIADTLIARYGRENVVWPIVLIEGSTIIAYLYERTKKNEMNSEHDNRPLSLLAKEQYYLDYCSDPRRVHPSSPSLAPFLSASHNCSYDYVVSSPYSTVDIDYAWLRGERWRGIEVTTFWVEFVSRERVENLISKLNRRPSWQGAEGPHGLRKIVEAAQDLRIDLYMACVNTLGKVSNQYKTDGNVYLFPLSQDQIDRLTRGAVPAEAEFLKFSDFLKWL